MRFVIVGLGGIGGTLAVRLTEVGQEVIGVARGRHLDAVRAQGLRFETPTATTNVPLDVREDVRDVGITEGDTVVIAVKSQDTAALVGVLAACAPEETPVLCAQNGVANEPAALRRFPKVYGVVVMCPTAHVSPGVVRAYSTPVTGLLDVGRYPSGEDEVSTRLAQVLVAAGYDSRSIADVSRWKYTKLLTNLGNAVEAICGPAARSSTLTETLHREGREVLESAGIDYATAEEDQTRRGSLLDLQPIQGQRRPGGSVWQSVARHALLTEVDYLNGEICLLGRLHGVPTPANAIVQRLTTQIAYNGFEPGSVSHDEVMSHLSG